MATAPSFSTNGSKATSPAKLDSKVFGVTVSNHDLLKHAYLTYLANGRINLAVTKTRGLVSGGGKKPWKQKGTGRARFGSSRNPIWRGGGIAFGPTGEENYSKKLPVSSKRLALRQALTLASDARKLAVIDKLEIKDAKTSQAASLLSKIGAKRRILLVVENQTPELLRGTSNLSDVKLVSAKYLNVYDLLNADSIVLTSGALKQVETWLSPTEKPKEATL